MGVGVAKCRSLLASWLLYQLSENDRCCPTCVIPKMRNPGSPIEMPRVGTKPAINKQPQKATHGQDLFDSFASKTLLLVSSYKLGRVGPQS